MKFTERQRYMLDHLSEISVRRKSSGRPGYFLSKDDCTGTINSLIVKGVIVKEANGKGLRLAMPHSACVSPGTAPLMPS